MNYVVCSFIKIKSVLYVAFPSKLIYTVRYTKCLTSRNFEAKTGNKTIIMIQIYQIHLDVKFTSN